MKIVNLVYHTLITSIKAGSSESTGTIDFFVFDTGGDDASAPTSKEPPDTPEGKVTSPVPELPPIDRKLVKDEAILLNTLAPVPTTVVLEEVFVVVVVIFIALL